MDLKQAMKPIERSTYKIGRYASIVLYSVGVFLAVVTGIQGARFGGHYYTNWGMEFHLFTFASSLQYFTAAEAAFISFWIARYLRKRRLGGVRHPWLWFVVALGFAEATFDESLTWHERALGWIGHHNGFIYKISFGHGDNLFVISCGLGAIIFTIWFFQEIRQVKWVAPMYFTALFLLVLAGAIDYLPENILQHRLPLGSEELGEHFAGATFAISFILYALDRFRLMIADWYSSLIAEDTIKSSETTPTRPAQNQEAPTMEKTWI